MNHEEELDDIEKFDNEETSKELPLAWVALYVGLIIWGIWYFYMYSPSTTGWTQAGELAEIMKDIKK